MNLVSWTVNLSVNVRDGTESYTDFKNLGGYWNDIWAQILNDVPVITCIEIWRLASDHHDLQCQRRLQNSGNYMTENCEGDSRARRFGFHRCAGHHQTLNPIQTAATATSFEVQQRFSSRVQDPPPPHLVLWVQKPTSTAIIACLLACCEPFKEEDLQLSRHCRITECNQAMISNLDQVKNSTTLTRELFALTMIFRSRCQKQKFQIRIWWFAILDAAEQRRISRWRAWGGWGGGSKVDYIVN